MKPNFAIIGCGRIARRHAEQINRIGNLVAVCDIELEAAAEFAAEYDARLYTDLTDLLLKEPSVEIISICTPNGLHSEHAIQSLRGGRHVLCEKPFSIQVRDARRMIDMANATDRKLFVVKQNRYNPPIEALRKLLKEDRLVNIYSFQINCFWNRPQQYYSGNWKGTRHMDGGSLFTQFSHFIDLLYWLLGDVKDVKAKIRNFDHPEIEIEDTGVVLFEMMGGAIGTLNYTVNSYKKNMEGSFTLFAERGTVKIGGQYLNELEYQCIEGEPIPDLAPGKPANAYGFYQGSMSNHDKVYEHLIKALTVPGYEFASALDGMKTVEIIEKIYAAARTS